MVQLRDPSRAPHWRFQLSQQLVRSRAFVSPRDFDLQIAATVAFFALAARNWEPPSI